MSNAPHFDHLVDQETLYSSTNPTRRWLHVSRREWVLAAVRRHAVTRSAEALEVGPGAGVYLPTLAALYERVTALEYEHAFVEHDRELVKQHPNLELVVGDIAQCGLRSGVFQLILCSEVIEHVREPEAAFRELHRLLAADGVLILTTPQRYSSLEQLARVAYLPGVLQIVRRIYGESVWDDGHISLMTEGEVLQRLQEVGFAVLEQTKLGFYVPLVAEFGGEPAVRLAKKLEQRLRSADRLSWLLWTQCYVLSK